MKLGLNRDPKLVPVTHTAQQCAQNKPAIPAQQSKARQPVGILTYAWFQFMPNRRPPQHGERSAHAAPPAASTVRPRAAPTLLCPSVSSLVQL